MSRKDDEELRAYTTQMEAAERNGDPTISFQEWKRKRRGSGGTMRATSFKSRPNRDNPNRVNHYFNGPGDGNRHGHVQEERGSGGTVSYPYVRDVESNEYDV